MYLHTVSSPQRCIHNFVIIIVLHFIILFCISTHTKVYIIRYITLINFVWEFLNHLITINEHKIIVH